MQRTDYRNILFLTAITLIIYYPVCYTHYFYSDEVLQLFQYRKGSAFQMFRPQGRYITDILLGALYSSVDTIAQLARLRMFSLGGWLLCLPVWYKVIATITKKEALPGATPFFTVLYLVTCPSFSVSVQWVACLELFLANTSALLAGYLIWAHVRYDSDRLRLPAGWILLSVALSLVALFSYQSGIGCFLLPFLLQAIAQNRVPRTAKATLAIYFGIYIIYFLLFSWYLAATGMAGSDRAGLLKDPASKVYYLFAKVLPGAFSFNVISSETSWMKRIITILLAASCLLWQFRRNPDHSRRYRLGYAGVLLSIFILVYLPSMVIRENYASNRTLLALDMAVFIWVFTIVYPSIQAKRQSLFAIALALFLVAGSWYNYRYLFLPPAVEEYQRIQAYIRTGYHPGITTVYYIRTPEDQVRKHYGVSSSWDEFGFSSSYFLWVPEYIPKQMIWEQTGDRALAERIEVKNWPDKQSFLASGQKVSNETLVIDAASILP